MGNFLCQPPEDVVLDSATDAELRKFWKHCHRVGKGTEGYLYEYAVPPDAGGAKRSVQCENGMTFVEYKMLMLEMRKGFDQRNFVVPITETVDYTTLNEQVSRIKSDEPVVDYQAAQSLVKFAH